MIEKDYFIFDMDGTLLDTMVYWRNLAKEYFEGKYKIEISEEMSKSLLEMRTYEAVETINKYFNINCDFQKAKEGMLSILHAHYLESSPHKPGVEEFLRKAKSVGKKMCVASASPNQFVIDALKKAGLYDCFEFVITTYDVKKGKSSPEIYLEAIKRMGATKENTAVFEDAIYAVKTVKKEGIFLVGVEDRCSESNKQEIMTIADIYISDYSQIT